MNRRVLRRVAIPLAVLASTAAIAYLVISLVTTLGNNDKSEKYMKVYVDKFPDERRAASYRRVLERQGATAP